MASGDTLLEFHPYNNEFPTTPYATLDLRNYHPVLDFDASTNETAVFTGIMPRNYDGNGITVYLHWAASTDTTNTHHCFWDASLERMTEETFDLDGTSFSSVVSVDTDHCSSSSGRITVTQIPFSSGAAMDGIGAGDVFRLKITRDATNDDMTGDAELVMIEIKET